MFGDMIEVSKAGAGLSGREEMQQKHIHNNDEATQNLRAVDEKEPALYLQIETYILI